MHMTMKYSIPENCALFRGIRPDDLEPALICLQAYTRVYPRGDAVLRAGDTVRTLGVVLSGSVSVEYRDVWGNNSLLAQIGPGQIFAETYACLPDEPAIVDVAAAEPAEILFVNTERLLHPCTTGCASHLQLLTNLLSISAHKNLLLSRRISHTTPKTIRGRLRAYLSFEALRQGETSFDISFNRQQLADYLSVDRSALSNELSKMRAEGLLDFRKNHFTLHFTQNPKNG